MNWISLPLAVAVALVAAPGVSAQQPVVSPTLPDLPPPAATALDRLADVVNPAPPGEKAVGGAADTGKAPAAAPAAKAVEKKDDAPKYWVVGDNLGMTARWNHGLHVESADKAFRIHPVGRVQWDTGFMAAGQTVQFGQGGVGRVDDGTAFRRLRFGVEGTLWEVVDFWIEPDFVNTFNAQGANEAGIFANTLGITDVWVQVTHLPWIGNAGSGVSSRPTSSST